MMRVVDIMHARSVSIMEEKKRAIVSGDSALLEQIGEGKDVMSILRMVPFYPIVQLITALSQGKLDGGGQRKAV